MLVAAVCTVFTLQSAKATVITFPSVLNVGNSAISGFPAPYGTVNVVLDTSTTATVTFTSNTSGNPAYLFGGAQGTDLNVNASSFTATGFSWTQTGTGFSTPKLANGGGIGSGQVDGLGDFNLTIDYFDGFKLAFSSVEFTLTNTSGTTWASASDVLFTNANGFDAAAHVFVTDNTSGIDQGNGAIATGFAGEAPGPFHVPDGGATACLLGLGLAGLGGIRARFGRK